MSIVVGVFIYINLQKFTEKLFITGHVYDG